MRHHVADLVIDAAAELAEGPVWNAQRQTLCFVDISGRKLHEWNPTDGRMRSLATPEMIGCLVHGHAGGTVVALASGIWTLDERTETFTLLSKPVEHDSARCRFNDGKCDPQGRFWAGTMSLTGEAEAGALYCFEAGQKPRIVLPRVTASNGLAWSLDGMGLYYIDSRTRRVDTFSFDPEMGAISLRRPVIDLTATGHIPDGCTLDSEGMLWIAHWRGGCVSRWDPRTGKRLALVTVSAPHVSSCAFGGPRFETLYITTARTGLTPEQLAAYPGSGGVFACQPGVPGLPAGRYN